jgi:hypothetical protein
MGATSNVIDLNQVRRERQREQRAAKRSAPKRLKVRQLLRRDDVRIRAAAAL